VGRGGRKRITQRRAPINKLTPHPQRTQLLGVEGSGDANPTLGHLRA
jgi:hypothetical protein